MANIKLNIVYILVSTIFIILFGELLAVFLAGNPVFLNHWFVITLYYFVITFIFSLFVFRLKSLVIVPIFFVYGVIAETFIFGNIKGLTDIVGILFFGNQYIALFGIPYILTKKILKIRGKR